MDSDSHNQALMQELLEEKASAYLRILRNMEKALLEWNQFNAQFADRRAMSAEEIKLQTDLFEAAAEHVWFFVIQREALGLPNYPELFEEYEIPLSVKEKMGPRRLTP